MSQSYRYRAARADGSMVCGRIEAGTGAQAAALLLDRGLHPVEVSEAALGESRRPASRRDLAVVFRSLAALVEAGVPLERAVSSSEGLARGALLSCLAGARQRLREGKSLAQALDSDRGTVPGLVLGMLRAGERAGRLPATLEQVATHLELEAELLSRVRHALAYPALLTIAGLVSVVVIGAVVVPKFAALLGEAGQELPPSTRLLLLGSAILTRYWLPLLLWTCVAAWFLAAWLQRPAGRARWHRLLLSIPVVGRIRHGLATVRVARALSGALDAGMPLLPAIEAATASAEDREVGARLARARERVAGGEALTSALAQQRALTPSALQLVAVGEGSGRLASMVRRAGDLAAQESQRAIATLVGMLEPALVILLGGFVAFVAAALLQAIYGLRPGGV
ncbi:MAG: type II secretion system F family protein [Gemmatimonadales bacterium]